MNKAGEIIIIEDDPDDQRLFDEVFQNLHVPNKVLFFTDGELALEHLQQPGIKPFLVISDINLPKLTGFELRERVFTNQQLSKKCIPYIFFTTSTNRESIERAYALSAQGFFVKPPSFIDLERIVKTIIDYWKNCYSPNDM